MKNNSVKYEVLVKKYLPAFLDVSAEKWVEKRGTAMGYWKSVFD